MLRRLALLFVISVAFYSRAAMAQSALYVRVSLSGDTYNDLDSYGSAWVESNGETWRSTFDYRHWIHLSSSEDNVVEDSGSQHSSLVLTVEDRRVSTGLTPNCYRSRFAVTAVPNGTDTTLDQAAGSGERCGAPPPQPPKPDPPPVDSCDGGTCYGSPIVFSLSGPYTLSGAHDAVQFDIDANGSLDRVTWTAGGSDEAFLALDRDADGLISDGHELFGDATLLSSGTRAENGFEALREFDANHDGRIDRRDPIWNALLLWSDKNHDGISSFDELAPLASDEIAGISLDYQWTGRVDRYGNQFRYQAAIDAEATSRVHRKAYDVYFVLFPWTLNSGISASPRVLSASAVVC